MRIRDLRWYILTAIIIIFSYAAISFCYYLSVKNGKVEISMKAIATEVTQGRVSEAEEKINDYYTLFTQDVDNKLTKFLENKEDTENKIFEECVTQSRLTNKFNGVTGKKMLLARDSIFNPQATSVSLQDTNFYVYFQKIVDGAPLTVRISVSKIFGFSTYNTIVFEDTKLGNFIYKTYDGVAQTSLSNLVGDFTQVIVDEKLAQVYTIAGEPSVLVALKLKGIKQYINEDGMLTDFYLATVIPTRNALLGSEWIISQALIFFFAGVIVMLGMLILMMFGVQTASRLLRVDRNSAENVNSIVIRIDDNGNVIFTNKNFKKMYGPKEFKNINDFIDVRTQREVFPIIKSNKTFECVAVDNDGNEKILSLTPIHISMSYYLTGSEITVDYNRRRHLEVMSGKNEITNCENGFILANQFESILEENAGFDLAFVEYNIHKHNEIISVFGQTNYNDLLKAYLEILRNSYLGFSIYHMSEAKFMVLVPNNDINMVVNKIEETLKIFRRPVAVRQNNIYVRTKVMVFNYKHADYENKKITLDMIKEKLDLSYRNRNSLSSKDYIIYEPSMDSIILAADEMEKDLIEGMKNNEFQMYLQPQFDVTVNKIVGFEALIRWLNPKYKSKSPQVFIELAEQRGYILDIGRFVIKETFKLAKQLEPYNVHISINVSPVQLIQVGFAQELIDEAKALELKPSSIAIEITETLLMSDFILVNEKLKVLKNEGFSIHLDDFCTGYSSMLYLKDLPIDVIKIDKDFTKYIETNVTHEAIVRTLCNLANSLKLGIICEGVETEVQKNMVKKMGCKVIQGFLIGKAMPYDDAKKLLEKYNG